MKEFHELSMRIESIAYDIDGLYCILDCMASSDNLCNCESALSFISRTLDSIHDELQGAALDVFNLRRQTAEPQDLC